MKTTIIFAGAAALGMLVASQVGAEENGEPFAGLVLVPPSPVVVIEPAAETAVGTGETGGKAGGAGETGGKAGGAGETGGKAGGAGETGGKAGGAGETGRKAGGAGETGGKGGIGG